MDFFALLLPLILIVALIGGLVVLRRRMFSEAEPAPIPIPDVAPDTAGTSANSDPAGAAGLAVPPPAAPAPSSDAGPSLTPARLYPRTLLTDAHKSVYSRLLQALRGYVVLPKVTYDHFLEARDGSVSENTSLQNRAAQHLADFVICDKALRVLLVCQVEDGSQLPARVQEREKMLQKAGLRLLRWDPERPPDADALLHTVQTLEKMGGRM